ncbi:MAG: methionine--tRNA ligase [Acidobacteriota bacterium]|nr:methionine--tRNA ligase [Acidobacteriota bacterium]
MSRRRTFYVTTPIYYVNDLPHIGHTYTTVVADALARFHRLKGDDVHFLTGTDEHGQKMQRAADARGVTPKQLADSVVENYKKIWPALGISHDDFIRTTEPRHRRGVYAMFEKIRKIEPDAIYKGTYKGLYCTGCESFYAANQVVGGLCPDEGHPVEEVEEESWFFRLSTFEERLLELYATRPEFVMPATRLNEVKGFVAEGLRDLSISRSRAQVSWGIPFPRDDEQVIYVWFDALTNYISALGYGSDDEARYERFWGEGAGRSQLHLIGKDILRFHAVYWPAFLMAAREPLPTTVFAHGWWLSDEKRMSKSRGNFVRPGELLDDFGPDAVRWFLLREISLGLDGSFSDEALIDRANADLANNIGNLFSRVVSLVARDEDGTVPATDSLYDDELREHRRRAGARFSESFERHDPGGALRAITDWADAVNRYLVRHEPWRRAGREQTCSRLLNTACRELAHIAVRLHPAMPMAAGRLLRMIGLPEDPLAIDAAAGEPPDLLGVEDWPVAGRAVRAGGAVFPRIDKKALLAGAAGPAGPKRKEAQAKVSGESQEGTARIGIDTFLKSDLRTARIVEAEPHPNADRLLRIVVDLGGETRQIIAGIAGTYSPEELVGRTIVIVANLKPTKLRGLESQGMLLAATGADDVPRLLTVDGDAEPGAKIS